MRLRAGRAYWLDLWRGLAVVAMIIYHACYDLVVLFGLEGDWFWSRPLFLFQQSIGLSFSILAGMGMAISRHSLKHGTQIFALAWGLTLVTRLAMPDQAIYFGVLHMLGASLMLLSLAKPALKACPQGWGLFASFVLFLAFWPLGGQGLAAPLVRGTEELGWLGVLAGNPPVGFTSSDYYPLLPWIGAVAFGFFLQKGFPMSPQVGENRQGLEKGLLWAGQHALPIYFLHQPLLILLLFPLSRLWA